jgi:hypothetical protein
MHKTHQTPSCVKDYYSSITKKTKQLIMLFCYYELEMPAKDVAQKFNYTESSVFTIARDWQKRFEKPDPEHDHFLTNKRTSFKIDSMINPNTTKNIVALRKNNSSMVEIQNILKSQNIEITISAIQLVLDDNGLGSRLPRRTQKQIANSVSNSAVENLVAPISKTLDYSLPLHFSTRSAGLMIFQIVIRKYKIDELILNSEFPETGGISRLSSIMAILAIKLTHRKRYSRDETWCFDYGMGLFAGLNVLPKAAWLSNYASSVTYDQCIDFLIKFQKLLKDNNLLTDTINLDFTAIPFFGDEKHLENNWSGKYGRSLTSFQALIVQDAGNKFITYSDATLKHSNQNDVILEVLDTYKNVGYNVKHVVFDSKFTTYSNLDKLDDLGIAFITIQRRSKNTNAKGIQLLKENAKTIKIDKANNRHRDVTYSESTTSLPGYEHKTLRQIFIKTKSVTPAVILTNDFKLSAEKVIKKYSQRWLVENTIAEQIHFFHMNKNASSLSIKINFELTMTVFAHNLYRLLENELLGSNEHNAEELFERFIDVDGSVELKNHEITIDLQNKRSLGTIINYTNQNKNITDNNNNKLIFKKGSHN